MYVYAGRFIASGIVATTLIEKYLSGHPTAMVAESPQVNASSDPLFSQFVSGLALSITLVRGRPRVLIYIKLCVACVSERERVGEWVSE